MLAGRVEGADRPVLLGGGRWGWDGMGMADGGGGMGLGFRMAWRREWEAGGKVWFQIAVMCFGRYLYGTAVYMYQAVSIDPEVSQDVLKCLYVAEVMMLCVEDKGVLVLCRRVRLAVREGMVRRPCPYAVHTTATA